MTDPDRPKGAKARPSSAEVGETLREGFLTFDEEHGLTGPAVVKLRAPPKRRKKSAAAGQAGAGKRGPIAPEQPPVRFESQVENSSQLIGSTRLKGASASQVAEVGVKQWTGTLLRVVAPRPTSARDQIGYQVEVRAFIFCDGKDVLRFAVYRDPDSIAGFGGTGRAASYSIEVREVHVLRPVTGKTGEVHFRYEGQLNIAGRPQLEFRGAFVFTGRGKAVCDQPRLSGGEGKTAIVDGCAVVGWW